MEAIELKNLDFKALMLAFKDNSKERDKILELVFKLIKKEGTEALNDYSFLNGVEIPESLLEKYEDKAILYILALNKALPEDKIIDLAVRICTYKEIYFLAASDIISEEILLANLKSESACEYIISKLKKCELKDKEWLIKTLKFLILIEDTEFLPVSTKIMSELKNIKMSHDIYNLLAELLVQKITNSEMEFIDLLKERKDILVLYQMFLKNSTLQILSNLNTINAEYLESILTRIKAGTYYNLAWVLEVYKNTSLSKNINLVEIINAWLRNNNLLAYQIYSEYLFGEQQNYEEGKLLDLKYESERKKERGK